MCIAYQLQRRTEETTPNHPLPKYYTQTTHSHNTHMLNLCAYRHETSGGSDLVCQLIVHPQNHTIAPSLSSPTAARKWWVCQLHYSAHSDWCAWDRGDEVKVHECVHFAPRMSGVLPQRMHFRLHPLIVTIHLPNLYKSIQRYTYQAIVRHSTFLSHLPVKGRDVKSLHISNRSS